VLEAIKARAQRLKAEVFALYFAARHPGTPWYAKALIAGIVTYALSPIDLIPDFIPVLGLLDELVLLPIGIILVLRMVPAGVMAECRAQATSHPPDASRAGRIGAAVIVVSWVLFAALSAGYVIRRLTAE
jgi:uncharacterized membrane protein YkvA (DUF1232 family)